MLGRTISFYPCFSWLPRDAFLARLGDPVGVEFVMAISFPQNGNSVLRADLLATHYCYGRLSVVWLSAFCPIGVFVFIFGCRGFLHMPCGFLRVFFLFWMHFLFRRLSFGAFDQKSFPFRRLLCSKFSTGGLWIFPFIADGGNTWLDILIPFDAAHHGATTS